MDTPATKRLIQQQKSYSGNTAAYSATKKATPATKRLIQQQNSYFGNIAAYSTTK
jgi:hypothetical protein